MTQEIVLTCLRFACGDDTFKTLLAFCVVALGGALLEPSSAPSSSWLMPPEKSRLSASVDDSSGKSGISSDHYIYVAFRETPPLAHFLIIKAAAWGADHTWLWRKVRGAVDGAPRAQARMQADVCRLDSPIHRHLSH